MPLSEQSPYVPVAEPDGPFSVQFDAEDARLARWARQALRPLSFHPHSGRASLSSVPSTICLTQGMNVRSAVERGEEDSSTTLAEDARGRLTRTETGWEVRRPGYLLSVQEDTERVVAHIDSTHSRDRQRIAVARALRHGLTVLLPRNERYPLHAAGACVPQRPHAVLIVGPSGSGKSTLTAGLVRRGWDGLSGDLLTLAINAEQGAKAYGLTSDIRLAPDVGKQLGIWGQGTDSPYGASNKRAFGEAALGKTGRREPDSDGRPHWLLFPTITDEPDSRIDPLPQSEALGAVLRQMHPPAMLPTAAAKAQFEAAAALVRQSRCDRLRAGCDLYRDPGGLADLLAATAERSSAQTGSFSSDIVSDTSEL